MLAHHKSGSYQVVQQIEDVAFCLKLPESWKIHDVFHRSLLHKKLGPSLPHQKLEDAPPPLESGRAQEYKVEYIHEN